MNPTLQAFLVTAAGGALGASVRFAVLSFAVPGALGIFVLNVLGALLLGIVLTVFEDRNGLVTLFLGTGLLGALTTFSTFASDAVRLLQTAPIASCAYVIGSVTCALAAFYVGTLVAKAAL
ncbi:MAG: CrcB family protein [Pseudomonadota bacterium]